MKRGVYGEGVETGTSLRGDTHRAGDTGASRGVVHWKHRDFEARVPGSTSRGYQSPGAELGLQPGLGTSMAIILSHEGARGLPLEPGKPRMDGPK